MDRGIEIGSVLFRSKSNQTRPLWPQRKNAPPMKNVIEIHTEGKDEEPRSALDEGQWQGRSIEGYPVTSDGRAIVDEAGKAR